MVRNTPEKYFGCFWTKPPYAFKAKVFPRDCIFFGDGMERSESHPEAFAATKAVYCVLPARFQLRPDKYTDHTLAAFGQMKLSAKSPGRQQGYADVPGLAVLHDVDPADIRQG